VGRGVQFREKGEGIKRKGRREISIKGKEERERV